MPSLSAVTLSFYFLEKYPAYQIANLDLLIYAGNLDNLKLIFFRPKEALNKTIPFMVRQAEHERNQTLTVRSEPVEGLNQ